MSSGKCIEPGCEKWAQFVGKCIGHGDVPHILDEARMTHQEIADVMGMTQQSVWQTERGALLKLQQEMKRRGLTLEDFVEVR